MKKALLALVAGSLLAGSVWAQTAVTPAPVTGAAAKVQAATAPVTDAAAKVKATTAPVADVAAKAAPAASAIKSAVTPAAAPAAATPAPAAPAVATDGKVWVNGKVYHCPGTKFYGKTKKGEYMTSADAKAKGAHIAKGQKCD